MYHVRLLINQVEITFWTYVIHLMHGSKTIQVLLRRYYEIRQYSQNNAVLTRLFLVCLAGWVVGFIAGLISLLWTN